MMPSVINEKYQTFWPRFWASLIDFIIWLPLLFFEFWVDENLHSPFLLALWLIFYSLSYYIYSVYMHARFGQTLGKMVLGLKVLDAAESKLTFRQAFFRDSVSIVLSLASIVAYLPGTLSGISRNNEEEFGLLAQFEMYGMIFWVAVLLISVVANSKRRGVHDYIANSVVVRTKFAIS